MDPSANRPLNINFFNLHQALLGASDEYLESEKTPTLLSKVAKVLRNVFLGKLVHDPKDQARAVNLRTIVRLLDPGAQGLVVTRGATTHDQRMLLVLTQTLLSSSSKKLRKIALTHLIQPEVDAHGNVTAFGNKAFYFDGPYAYQLSQAGCTPKSLSLAVNHMLRHNITKIGANLGLANGAYLPLANKDAVDRLLTEDPKNSITRTPLLLLSNKKFRQGTPLDIIGVDVVRIIARLVDNDVNAQVKEQFRAAAFSPAH